MKILVVDDDLELLGLLSYALRHAGYLVVEATDGAAALRVFEEEQPDLGILDVNLPRMNGFDLVRALRQRGFAAPLMMLTVRSAEEDQVRALDCGADDFLTKPFSPRTLLARVHALLRRAGQESAAGPAAGDLRLDPEEQTVCVRGGDPVSLTRLEFRLLHFLVANAAHVVSSDRLTAHVWGDRGYGDRQLLKQLVRRLRQKVESDPAHPRYIVAETGVGYKLVPKA